MPPTSARWKLGAVQMRCTADLQTNLRTAAEGVRSAAAQGATVVCLPELFGGPYFCQVENADLFDLAEPVPDGPTTQFMCRLAAELRVSIIVSLFERRAAGLYHNTSVILDADGSVAGLYRKMHIPDDPLFYEKFYFTPGDLGFKSWKLGPADVGVLVCWDQWYPEAARLTALLGSQVICYPTAIGWHPAEKARYGKAQHDAWRTVQRGHAVANGVYVCSVNRTGHEGPADAGLEFWGATFICDPQGQILAEAPHDREAVLVVEIDPAHQETIRRNWPFLRDRRIDAYGPIVRRWGAD